MGQKSDLIRRDSLGGNALTLDFMAVQTMVVFGTPVYKPYSPWQSSNNIMNDGTDVGVLYDTKDEFIFDSADVDAAILKQIKNAVCLDRKATPSLVAAKSLTEMFFGGAELAEDNRAEKLEALLETHLPSEMEWDKKKEQSDGVVSFIETQIPFPKTREWLYSQIGHMAAAQTDRFIAAVKIKSRSVYALH